MPEKSTDAKIALSPKLLKKQILISNNTLILVRWMAIFGQSIAIAIAEVFLGISTPLIPAAICIFMSLLVNIGAQITYGGRSLKPYQAWAFMVYDILQLTALLWLTGGLQNPFACLIIAPAAVAATLLPLRYTIFLIILVVTCTASLTFFAIPLQWGDEIYVFPKLYSAGEFLAISVAVIFISLYIWRISSESRAMNTAYEIAQLALARQQENASLGALSAAVAHELGSPLSTITLIANDFSSSLEKNPDLTLKELGEDIEILKSQTDKCTNLLKNFGKSLVKPSVKDLDILSADALIRSIAENYEPFYPHVSFDLNIQNIDDLDIPYILKTPSLDFGLGNLIQNSFKHAKNQVSITIFIYTKTLDIHIKDDGPGFTNQVLRKIGEPMMTAPLDRVQNESHTQDTKAGLGLGIFIALTLLEKYDVLYTFSNRENKKGAHVTLSFQRDNIEI